MRIINYPVAKWLRANGIVHDMHWDNRRRYFHNYKIKNGLVIWEYFRFDYNRQPHLFEYAVYDPRRKEYITIPSFEELKIYTFNYIKWLNFE